MNCSRYVSVGLAGALLGVSSIANADTEADRFKKLEDQVKSLLQRQKQLEDQQSANERTIAALLAERASKQPGGPAPKPAIAPVPSGNGDKFKFSGDATFRLNSTNLSSLQTGIFPEGAQGITRQRFRLNVLSPLSGRSEAGMQLSTGQTASPTVAFTALGDAGRGKGFSLSQAYFHYYLGAKDQPIPFQRLPRDEPTTTRVSFGKISQPFWRAEVGGPAAFSSEAMWDNDYMPEGANLRVPLKLRTDKVAITDNWSYYALNFPSKQRFIGLVTDTYGIGNQLYVNANMLRAGFTWVVYDNLNSGLFDPTFLPGQGIDPSLATSAFLLRSPLQTTNAHYTHGAAAGFGANSFSLINFTGQIIPQAKKNAWQPFLVYEFLHNGSVDVLNNGYGVSVGASKGAPNRRGAMTAWITWRDVDADATLATFADSDLGGGTDYRGYQLGLTYRLQDNLQLRLAYHDYDGAPIKTNSTQRFFFDFARFF